MNTTKPEPWSHRPCTRDLSPEMRATYLGTAKAMGFKPTDGLLYRNALDGMLHCVICGEAVEDRDYEVCIDCKERKPLLLRSGRSLTAYARCERCLEKYTEKRRANREAKLRRQAEAIRAAGANR